MKPSLRHIALTLLLCFSVLTSSMGMTLKQHLCLMTGEKMTSLPKKKDDCCAKKKKDKKAQQEPERQDPEKKSKKCCVLSVEHEKLKPETPLKFFTFPVSAMPPSLDPVVFQPIWNISIREAEKKYLSYSDSSPPLYGRSLLCRIHILIV